MGDRRTTELLERAAALAALADLRDDAAAGGRIALVTGVAGLGRTALVTEFVTRMGPAVPVLWGRCRPPATPRPLGPWHDIARQAGIALREDECVSREAGFGGLLDHLGEGRPVVVLEDVHWADAATLDLLILVGRRMLRTSALLVVTYRDDEPGPGHPVRAAFTALPREVVRRIPLAPLSVDAVSSMARGSGRDPADIHHRTGGNPLLGAAAASGAARLTARQQDVLELVAEGLTNRQIADRLTTTTKTVANHITAVLAKLDVTNRAQAAAVHRRANALRAVGG